AELPVEMSSLKSQQFRWMKGGAETAKKMLPTVWRSDLSPGQKVQATFHLLASSVFVFVFLTGILSVPLLFLMGDMIELGFNKGFFSAFLIGLLSIIYVYYVANVEVLGQDEPFLRSMLKFVFLFPLFLALSMGLSLHNSVAVLQGYLGKESPFVRTPKFNIQSIKDSFVKNKYVQARLSWITVFEGLLALYFLAALISGIYLQNTIFIFFHFLLVIGYGAIFYYTIRHLNYK
ncbi:MAG: histidine kinase, partial [Saprospiraceae bacterium]|nr:histidine kinase [Saprospiraceae bacterium]